MCSIFFAANPDINDNDFQRIFIRSNLMIQLRSIVKTIPSIQRFIEIAQAKMQIITEEATAIRNELDTNVLLNQETDLELPIDFLTDEPLEQFTIGAYVHIYTLEDAAHLEDLREQFTAFHRAVVVKKATHGHETK